MRKFQDYKNYLISENILFCEEKDWYKKVKEYYYNIPDSIFNKSVLIKNKHDLDKCIFFELTDSIMNSDAKDLSKFKF